MKVAQDHLIAALERRLERMSIAVCPPGSEEIEVRYRRAAPPALWAREVVLCGCPCALLVWELGGSQPEPWSTLERTRERILSRRRVLEYCLPWIRIDDVSFALVSEVLSPPELPSLLNPGTLRRAMRDFQSALWTGEPLQRLSEMRRRG